MCGILKRSLGMPRMKFFRTAPNASDMVCVASSSAGWGWPRVQFSGWHPMQVIRYVWQPQSQLGDGYLCSFQAPHPVQVIRYVSHPQALHLLAHSSRRSASPEREAPNRSRRGRAWGCECAKLTKHVLCGDKFTPFDKLRAGSAKAGAGMTSPPPRRGSPKS
jgi:hypothetical protein